MVGQVGLHGFAPHQRWRFSAHVGVSAPVETCRAYCSLPHFLWDVVKGVQDVYRELGCFLLFELGVQHQDIRCDPDSFSVLGDVFAVVFHNTSLSSWCAAGTYQ
jgi:hypothetical protein